MQKSNIRKTQAKRLQRVFAGFVLDAIQDAAQAEKRDGTGQQMIAEWADTRSGSEILQKAGVANDSGLVDRLRDVVSVLANGHQNMVDSEIMSFLGQVRAQ